MLLWSVRMQQARGWRIQGKKNPSLGAEEIAQWLGVMCKVITEDMSSRASPTACDASSSDLTPLATMRTVLKCTYPHNHKNKYLK